MPEVSRKVGVTKSMLFRWKMGRSITLRRLEEILEAVESWWAMCREERAVRRAKKGCRGNHQCSSLILINRFWPFVIAVATQVHARQSIHH